MDWVASIIRKVGSLRLKLLFDIYHVQIMHGDLIRRLDENKDVIGHVHTAGNPGRGELDETQEIQYPPLMKKLLEIKYEGTSGRSSSRRATLAPDCGRRFKFAMCERYGCLRQVSRIDNHLAAWTAKKHVQRVQNVSSQDALVPHEIRL